MNKEESDLIIAEQNKSTEEILKAVANVKSDYKELCNLKDMRIAELKEQISTKDILIKELQEQKVYWKESSFDWRHKFFKLDKVKRLIKKDKQLTKATEIIKELKALYLSPVVTKDDVKQQDEILNEAEQFLKYSEVEK